LVGALAILADLVEQASKLQTLYDNLSKKIKEQEDQIRNAKYALSKAKARENGRR